MHHSIRRLACYLITVFKKPQLFNLSWFFSSGIPSDPHVHQSWKVHKWIQSCVLNSENSISVIVSRKCYRQQRFPSMKLPRFLIILRFIHQGHFSVTWKLIKSNLLSWHVLQMRIIHNVVNTRLSSRETSSKNFVNHFFRFYLEL